MAISFPAVPADYHEMMCLHETLLGMLGAFLINPFKIKKMVFLDSSFNMYGNSDRCGL